MGSKSMNDNPLSGDGASPGKIFIGGLPKDTQHSEFNKHFGKYGEITDSVIMKDRLTGRPRGFGFITYADPSVVDAVMEDTHVFSGKQVEIKRTIPKGSSSQAKDFKTKKVFVGGIPSSVTEDELKNFFSKYGAVAEHQIIRDHETKRSRGFGFVIFDSEETVDELLSKGNMIDLSGTKVEVKKAEPKKSTNQPPVPAYGSKSRGRPFSDDFDGFANSYGSSDGGFGPGPYRTAGSYGRLGGYSGYGSSGSEYGGYGDYGGSALGGYRGESSIGYASRFGNYRGGFSGSYGGGGGGLGGYVRGEGYGNYGSGAGYGSGPTAAYGSGPGGYGRGEGYGGGYDSGPTGGYGGTDGGLYGRGGGGYGGSSRYHPYAR